MASGESKAKKLDLGPTGQRVAENLRELRRRIEGLTVYRMSERLKDEHGVSLQPSGLTRIERGERKVDVDELVAFSILLEVNPSALLLPRDVENDDEVELTRKTKQRAWVAWRWADGRLPLPEETVGAGEDKITTPWERMVTFQSMARPRAVSAAEAHPAHESAYNVAFYLQRLLSNRNADASTRAAWLAKAKHELRRLNFEVDQLLAQPEYQDPDVINRLPGWERIASLAPESGSDES
ncbi:helix-turn-helix domain-containing protein [Actinomadura geliboluensis]